MLRGVADLMQSLSSYENWIVMTSSHTTKMNLTKSSLSFQRVMKTEILLTISFHHQTERLCELQYNTRGYCLQ